MGESQASTVGAALSAFSEQSRHKITRLAHVFSRHFAELPEWKGIQGALESEQDDPPTY